MENNRLRKALSDARMERKIQDNRMKPLVRAVHEFSRQTYGSLRMQSELAGNGVILGRDQISLLRRELGLTCIQKKKFKATMISNHDHPVLPNLLEQAFSVMEPGIVYGTDITHIPTDAGWHYLAGVKDFGSRELTGHSMGGLNGTTSSAALYANIETAKASSQ
jgi:transposase InsO family protein